ncbi:hypothetical protein Ahy_A01g002912 isoform A [Arachis hypogaea]|nr:hypothetical protein Ahy_A01g002912 isoform A [Arachis hypogaea]
MAFFVVAIIGFVFGGGSDDGSLSLLSLISLFSGLFRLVLRSSLSVATSSTVASSSMESKVSCTHLRSQISKVSCIHLRSQISKRGRGSRTVECVTAHSGSPERCNTSKMQHNLKSISS